MYPIQPELTSAQAQADPFTAGLSNLEGFQNPQTGLSLGQVTAAAAGDATKSAVTSVSGALSSIADLFSTSNLTRLLVIIMGLIFLAIGLWMLGKLPTNVVVNLEKATRIG